MTSSHADRNVEDSSDTDFEHWRSAFRKHQELVREGIATHRPRPEREATLKQAKLVPDFETDDVGDLEIVASILENKLCDMVAVVKGEARGDLAYVATPPDLAIDSLPADLLDDFCVEERRWLFVGGALEMIHDYRDRGRHLLLKERQGLLRSLHDGISQISNAISELNSHLLVEYVLSDGQHAEIAGAIQRIRAAHSQYETFLTSTGHDGLSGVMEKNWYRIRNQFTVACTLLALRIYGNITKDALERLLVIKSVGYLELPSDGPPTQVPSDAERKHNERNRVRAVAAVTRSAKGSRSPVWPILQLYLYNARYGRRNSLETE